MSRWGAELRPTEELRGTYVYLVRHAQSKGQTGQQEQVDPELSELGVQQCAELGRALSAVPFDLALLSPLRRCLSTFTQAGLRAKRTRVDSRLIELGSVSFYENHLPFAKPDWAEDDRFPQAWAADPVARVDTLLAELDTLPSGRVLCVAHTGVLAVMLQRFMATSVGVAEPLLNCRASNASISVLGLRTPRFGQRCMLQWSSTAHLGPLLPLPENEAE